MQEMAQIDARVKRMMQLESLFTKDPKLLKEMKTMKKMRVFVLFLLTAGLWAFPKSTLALTDEEFRAICLEGSASRLEAALENLSDDVRAQRLNALLMTAIKQAANSEIVTVLLKAGADVNQKDEAGRTPLMFAVRDNPKVVSALVEAGADVNEKNSWGKPRLSSQRKRTTPPRLSPFSSRRARISTPGIKTGKEPSTTPNIT